MADLFQQPPRKKDAYTARDIEVLEGLEPVRKRPGMYIGGTDAQAMHHLAAEALDNAMDEAVAGHASWIDFELTGDGEVIVRDNGRGIPVDPHPKFKNKSALEVVMTTLHSGGKFSGEAYKTSGGLHGVGISVVNALSEKLVVEVARDKQLWTQSYSRGKPSGKLKSKGKVTNRRGTVIRFLPDTKIFGDKARFQPARLYRMAKAKAYLFNGVEIRWSCDPKLVGDADDVPAKEVLHFPGGLPEYLSDSLNGRETVTQAIFAGEAKFPSDGGRVEWAIAWPDDAEGFTSSYCNTVPTPQGGTHENGLRAALSRGLKAYGEMVGNRRASAITADDVVGSAGAILSVFVRDPEFQGQTKEKLSTTAVARKVENSVKDHFDHFLSGDPETANALLEHVIELAEERVRRRKDKEISRKTATRKTRLPGKLVDCTKDSSAGTEIFLVEGDSAGGTAKQARDRQTQAILPLRGKILNVASASADKLRSNQELADLGRALGCGVGGAYDEKRLRYERVIIMTDADVDGAHIASLLMTFFYREMPGLVENGHLYLAMPPLYSITQGSETVYARDDAQKDELLKNHFSGRGATKTSRFKGLGEMQAAQLRDTTMDPNKRVLLRVVVPAETTPAKSTAKRRKLSPTEDLIERLMGRKPELRLEFIQKNADRVQDLDI